MRIGVVGPAGPDRFADNIADSLRRIGHVVMQLGPARPEVRGILTGRLAVLARQARPSLDERAQQHIVRSALAAECEVVINVDARLMPNAVTQLKRAEVRLAFWYPDALENLGRQLMLLAPYDALFFKEPHLVERLRANLDVPVYYLPQGCNPRWHRPIGQAGIEPHLVVAGSMYPSRIRLLERLMAKGIPLRLYGGRFPRWLGETPLEEFHTRRIVLREEKARVFRSAAGVLNTMHPAEVVGVNSRLFEAAACGAAVLTEFRPTVPDLFHVGREVLAFHDFDDLLDQANRLLNETGLAGSLGDAAARRAHRDHSYDLRVSTILEKVS
jgi:spore maturation protein CgeB